MYGIYANIGGILMGSMLPYIAYMDPTGYYSIFHGFQNMALESSRQNPGAMGMNINSVVVKIKYSW